MSYEFRDDEIREAVNAAQIYSPGYSEEQFQASRELIRQLEESGYMEAVVGIGRWEKEKGVPCTEVLDAVEQLLSKKEQLEAEVAAFEEKRRQCQQVEAATEQAREELQAIHAERQKEEKNLVAFNKKAEKEKKNIEKELEECRQAANVTEEETATAGRLKAEVEKHGFGLDLVLGLAQEFASYEDSRDRLAEGLKRQLTLTECNNQLEEQKQALGADIRDLEENRQQLRSNLSQLQGDVAHEEELGKFYQRYYGWSGLLDWLASWEQVFFLRCNNPLYAVTGALVQSAGGAHVWTDKAGPKCPHCGLNTLVYDERLYRALNWPLGEARKLLLEG